MAKFHNAQNENRHSDNTLEINTGLAEGLFMHQVLHRHKTGNQGPDNKTMVTETIKASGLFVNTARSIVSYVN